MRFLPFLVLAADNGLFRGLRADDDAQRVLGSSLGPEDLSPEKQCEAAIHAYATRFPGFASIDIVATNTTNAEALRSFCPTVSHAARREHAAAFHAMERTCGASFASSVSYLSNIVCATIIEKNEETFCGAKVTEINAVFTDITKMLNGAKNNLSEEARAAMDGMLANLCDPCFDAVGTGLVRWMAEVNAAKRLTPHEPAEGPSEVTQLIGKLLDARVLCARNDSSQKNAEKFCVPWLLSEMLPLGSTCMEVQPKREAPTVADQRACLRNDECVWYANSACGALVDHFTDASTYAHLPPAAIHATTGANSCFLTVQNIIQQNKEILGDTVVPAHASLSQKEDVRRAHGAFEAVSAYGWLGAANSTKSCLGRWRSYAFDNVHSACNGAEIESVRSQNVKFSKNCAKAWRRVIDDLGCCFGALRELQAALDPEHSMLPNFAGIEKAVGSEPTAPCDAYGDTAKEIFLKVCDLTCADLEGSDADIVLDAAHRDVAALLGVPKQSVHSVALQHGDGTQCGKEPKSGDNALQIKCAVAVASAERLERVAVSARELPPVVLPTVQYIIHKDREVAKRMAFLEKQRTKGDKVISEKLYISFKIWAITMCCIVALLAASIFVILYWRDKVTFVWCWSCTGMPPRRRAKRAEGETPMKGAKTPIKESKTPQKEQPKAK